MTDWEPLRLTMSIMDVEGDNQYFDPGRYTATVKLNSGANIQLDLADPESSGSLYLNDQYDTLRITLKDKSSGQVYGSVSFDAEMFRDNSVVQNQWVTLHSSSLSDAFKGEIGRDQRDTPRILLGYDAIPHNENESRGRTTSKRTKETAQQDRGSHDSRKKKSARSGPAGRGLIVEPPNARVVSQRGGRTITKTTKVEKQFSSSSRGSNLGASGRSPKLGATENAPYSASRISTTSSRKVTKRTTLGLGSSARSPKSAVVGGLEHNEVEGEIKEKTKAIIMDFLNQTKNIEAEEKRMIDKLKVFERSNARLDRDEQDLAALKSKAERDLESIKTEAIRIQQEEENAQRDLLRELERLEQEYEDIEIELEREEALKARSAGRKVTLGGLYIKEEEQINGMKEETQSVLDDIKDAVRGNRIQIEESSFDPIFREDLDRHANDIIEKENQRHEIELDIIEMEGEARGDTVAAEINEASLNYQRSQRDALQKEYDRVSTMYDTLATDIRRELDDEMHELDQLRDYYRRLEDDRDHFRMQVDHLKTDSSMTYSLDAGSGPVKGFGRSRFDEDISKGGGFDEEIRRKVLEVEEAEKARREAEIELDKRYDQWRNKIDIALDNAYVKLTTPHDRRLYQEISNLMIENDKVSRSLNALIAEKERLENLLYLRKTNKRLTETVKLDEKSFGVRMSSIKKEDRELMEELNKSDNALLSKNTALRELDDKIRVLSRKYADLEAEAQEKKGLISSLRVKHDHIRLEIERLRGLINEDELAALELDLRNKEARLRGLQAQVDEAELIVVEWREKIILKQRLVKSRTQTRALLFEPDPSDPADTRLADYVLSHVTTVPVKKIGKNRYLFGTKNLDTILTSSGVKVKLQNGEVLDLEEFIGMYHDKELQKLDALGDNEELVVDEKDDYRYQENVRMQSSASPHHPYGYANNESYFGANTSRQGETFVGYDAFGESEVRSTRMRSNRHF